jgi:hypothetical protein
MNAQKRKRAPGAGRKPADPLAPKTSQLTVRIPDYMRAQLKTAADERHWSLTDELLRRLRASFAREREQQRDPALRALFYLISETARGISYMQQKGGKDVVPKWNVDPSQFKALRSAMLKLLDALEPPGEVKPLEIPNARESRSPTSLGNAEAKATLRKLFDAEPYDAASELEDWKDYYSQAEWFRTREDGTREEGTGLIDELVEFFKKVTANRQREFYAMSDARRDLEISKPKGE